ncbi:MAG: SsrA-binding protein [candidate division CPR1 bacterium GW2011_GWA2_42_17]|uniref:SsrA-binding protein n=1 Tax=candidate division CPR1 bacterium GW2011_GWA2_42_17 TaxID=1618341 RepID=A0A0G0Z535_9BACT|nr:MAG: SsrA-binding protein [candidate division CPR1 bacterium GW2011_GWA2_42_17]
MGTLALHRELGHNFTILDTCQAGMKLLGWEVKSLRAGQCKIKDAVAVPTAHGLSLINLSITPYAKARAGSMNPARSRALLMSKKEIANLSQQLGQNKSQLLALKSIYTKGGLIKCELALVEKKRKFDKRRDIRKKEITRRLKRFTR